MNIKIHFLLFLWIAFQTSCQKDEDNISCHPQFTQNTRFYEFEATGGTRFLAWTDRQEVIERVTAELAKDKSERTQHINGKILHRTSTCKNNFDFSWYFDPSDWDLADISIELCDGSPGYVEENLEEYIRIGRYCPWSSIVAREISNPFN